MRDIIKDERYFREYIAEENYRLQKFITKLKSNQVREDRITAVREEIDRIHFGLFVAKYSLGEDLDTIKGSFKELITDMPKFWHPISGYIDMLWMISISIMYEIDDAEWDILVGLVTSNNIHDWLIYYLISSRSKVEFELMNIKMKNPYQKLKDIVEGGDNIDVGIKDYLDNYWYEGHREMGWYNIHQHRDKIYNGYWSFESGAIVKILGLDDTILKDAPYYPYDLVHYGDKKQV